MKKQAALAAVLMMMITACGADLSKLPPIVISIPPPSNPPPRNSTPPAPTVGTLAFEVVDDAGQPICLTLSLHTGEVGATNREGYVKFDGLFIGPRHVSAHYTCEDGDIPDGRTFDRFEVDALWPAGQAEYQQRVVIPRVKPATPPADDRPLVNLNIVVHDAAGVGIPGAACIVRGLNTVDGSVEQRIADGGGFINFAVRGVVETQCRAVGFLIRAAELPPGDHRIGLAKVELPPEPKPAPKPDPSPGSLCAERVSAPLECVRKVAVAFPELLAINTFESTMEFTQRVLAVLGPDYGHVGKSARESQSVPKGFTPIDVEGADGKTYHITGASHDAIKHRGTGQVVDLLGNATANEPCDASKLPPGEKCWEPGPASIQWNLIPKFAGDGTLLWRNSNPFIPAVPVR